jgi:hypothetical protein
MVMTTALYAGILALISIVLGFLAGSMRGRLQIPFGDGGNKELMVAIRRHANFTEFVPLIVVMMAMIELNGMGKLWLHVIGATIVVARVLHPLGLSPGQMSSPLRAIGAMLTALTTVTCGLILIWQGVSALLAGAS